MLNLINDLNESLRSLIESRNEELGKPAVLFEIPSREWASNEKIAINFHFYDIRENLDRRETPWQRTDAGQGGDAVFVPRPVRLNLSYLVTCWSSKAEDQYRLLWGILELLTQNAPLPEKYLKGELSKRMDRVPMQVAQPDGVLQNVSEFWTTLGNQVRPSISLVATLELTPDVPEKKVPVVVPVVGKVSQPLIRIRPGAVALRVKVVEVVKDASRRFVSGAEVALLESRDGRPLLQAEGLPDAADGYVFHLVPAGKYTLRAQAGRLEASRELEFQEDGEGAERFQELILTASTQSPGVTP